jgi:hypothetical protein
MPSQIYIIRHGEKPADPPPGQPTTPAPPFGVDVDGNQNPHCLLPRGWQRSGALAALFDPATGPTQAGLSNPTALFSPQYPTRVPGASDPRHRTYQTILGLSGRLGVNIQSPVPEGQEPDLINTILTGGDTVVLICWEHHHIPALAQAIPTVNAATVPPVWPDNRFDVIWSFTRDPADAQYTFGQIPEQLLAGDADTVI